MTQDSVNEPSSREGGYDPTLRVIDFPVAIVGGGPVGLMLALFLDRLGIRSVVFNSDETTRWHPKGSTHNVRTMEHYRRLGLAEAVRDVGLTRDHPTDVVYFTRLNEWELARIPMPSTLEKLRAVQSSARTDQTPEPIHRANQMYVERLLLKCARARSNIDLRFGWRVERFLQYPDHVQIGAVELKTGQTVSITTSYLAGCDGGQGTVRRDLGIHYGGFDNLRQSYLGGRMVSSYLKAPALYRDVLKARRGYQYWAVNSAFRNTLVALNGLDEFLFWSTTWEGAPEPNDEKIVQLFQQCVGVRIPVTAISHSPWTAGVAVVAESFGQGRVFLAGDSAHLFTPTGGFGMNTGVDDVANLSWKLAGMLQGWGGPNLLASYELERMPIAHRNTGAARKLAMNVGAVEIPEVIQDDTEIGARARHAVGMELSRFGEEFASLGVQLGARYDSSRLIVSDCAAPADDFVSYKPSSVPGGRLPHLWIDSSRRVGDSIFDRLSAGFTLLRIGRRAPSGIKIGGAAKDLGIPLTIVSVPDDDARGFYERDLLLVRPDQHVAWRGNVEPDDSVALLRRIVGF